MFGFGRKKKLEPVYRRVPELLRELKHAEPEGIARAVPFAMDHIAKLRRNGHTTSAIIKDLQARSHAARDSDDLAAAACFELLSLASFSFDVGGQLGEQMGRDIGEMVNDLHRYALEQVRPGAGN